MQLVLSVEYEPAGHSVQVSEPITELNLPASQEVQPTSLPPVEEYVPAGQHVIDTLSPVYRTVRGKYIPTSSLQSEKAELLIRPTLLQWNLTVCKELQLLNALLLMKVTLMGMITSSIFVDSNALTPSFVTVLGKLILLRPELEKTLSPITLSWLPDANKTLHRFLQSLNEVESIVVTRAGISTFPSLSMLLLQSRAVQTCPFPAAV